MMRKTGNLADAIGYGDDSAGAFLHPCDTLAVYA